MTLNEFKIQSALNSFGDNIRQFLNTTDDIGILKFVTLCDRVELRRAISVNCHLPYSIIKYLYNNDPDRLVKDCAWEHIVLRFQRRFCQDPPDPPWKRFFIPPQLP